MCTRDKHEFLNFTFDLILLGRLDREGGKEQNLPNTWRCLVEKDLVRPVDSLCRCLSNFTTARNFAILGPGEPQRNLHAHDEIGAFLYSANVFETRDIHM
jgi:hypothetical protein